MSNPPSPPSKEPGQPQTPSRNTKRTGAIVAIAAVVLISLMVALLGSSGIGLGAGLVAAPLVSLGCVIVGSILTIFERTRLFAVGFLIAGAIFLFVSAGVCVALIALISSSL